MTEQNVFEQPEALESGMEQNVSAEVIDPEKPWIVNGVVISRRKMNQDQARAYERFMKKKVRKDAKLKSEGFSREAASLVEVKKAEGLEIFSEIGLKNFHVMETVWSLLEIAARQNKLVVNDFLVRHGLRAALAKKQPAPPEPSPVIGELSTRSELFRLWDASLWRTPEVTFEQFLETRALKSDGYRFGEEVLQKDLSESCHKNWFDFWPRLDATTLKPGYSQTELEEWLDSQSAIKDFLLLASRNSRKSSTAICWLVSALVIAPDLSILMVSSTRSLSKGFIRALRSFFEVQNPNSPTKFQQCFPEFCIKPDDGSVLEFRNPMSHLSLIEPVESTSMDSSVAGRRAHIIVGDDICDNLNTATPDTRDSGAEKWALIGKLRTTSGLTLMQATPWHKDDTYARLIRQNDESSEKFLGVRIDPCWIIKKEAQHKPLKDLVESDIETYLFPEVLNWKFLSSEIRKNAESTFRSQNMVEFLDATDDKLKLNFDRDILTRAVLPMTAAPQSGDTIIFADTSYSTSPYADLSALAVMRQFTTAGGLKAACVMDLVSGRFRGSELAYQFVKLCKQWSPRLLICEKPPNFDLLESEVNRAAVRYEASVPLFFIPPSNQRDAKLKRIKAIEPLVGSRLFFTSGTYIDDLFNQLERLSATDSPRNKKNDLADAISIGCQFFRLHLLGDQMDKDDDITKLQADAFERAKTQAQYRRIFEGFSSPMRMPSPEEVPQQGGPLDEAARRLFGANSPFRL